MKKLVPKTQDEVEKEVAALKDLKCKIRRFSAFGDDHWKSIDVQIEVLEDNLDEDDIDQFDDPDLNSIAYETMSWAMGEEVDESPAEGWKSLLIK